MEKKSITGTEDQTFQLAAATLSGLTNGHTHPGPQAKDSSQQLIPALSIQCLIEIEK